MRPARVAHKIAMLLFAFIFVSALVFVIQPAQSQERYPSWAKIAILPDGTIQNTIDNSTAPIERIGNTYTLTGNIYGSLDIEANNVIVDGDGFTVQQAGDGFTQFGVTIYGCQEVTIKNVQVTGFFYPITLNSFDGSSGSNNCIISNNTITGGTGSSNVAIWVCGNNNQILSNQIIGTHGTGIYVAKGYGNVISDNYIADNLGYGVEFMGGSSSLGRNRLDNNTQGAFDFMEGTFQGSVNSIDSSNLVDGMPVYYGVNQQNVTVPSDTGYLVLVNCSNMLIQGLTISGEGSQAKFNSDSIILVNTADAEITDCTLTAGAGITCYWSTNITITRNRLSTGITLYSENSTVTDNSLTAKGILARSNNTIAKNNFNSCNTAIDLDYSSNSGIYENHIENSKIGLLLFNSDHNKIYHNDFINNSQQVYVEHYGGSPEEQYIFHTYFPSNNNTWALDYPAGGNYWSNYNGTDANGDGIGDVAYHVFENDTDPYPLMQPYRTVVSVPPPTSFPPSVLSQQTEDGASTVPQQSTISQNNVLLVIAIVAVIMATAGAVTIIFKKHKEHKTK